MPTGVFRYAQFFTEPGMNVLKGLMCAALGAVAGAAVWATLAYFTHSEFGFMAWALGAAVGLGMSLGSSGKRGFWMGAMASVVAIMGVLSGKLMVAHVIASEHVAKMVDSIGEVEAVASIRDDVMEQWLTEQRAMTWPKGTTPEEALDQGYVPPEVQKEASARWRRMSEDDRQQCIAGLKVVAANDSGAATLVTTIMAFVFSFGAFDLLWAFFAVGSAYSLAARGSKSEAAPIAEARTPATMKPGSVSAPNAQTPQHAAARTQPAAAEHSPRGAAAGSVADDSASRSFFRGASVTDDFPDPAAKFIKSRPQAEPAADDGEVVQSQQRDAA